MIAEKMREPVRSAWESGQAAGRVCLPRIRSIPRLRNFLLFYYNNFCSYITPKCLKSIAKATSARVRDVLGVYTAVPVLTSITRRV